MHTFMIFLTKKNFLQYSRRFLFLKLGGSTEKWGLLLAQTAPTLENHRKSMFLRFFFAHAAPCRCWKSYLPYSKRSENIINRKIRKFYIEGIPQKNLNSEKKIRARRKKFRKKNRPNKFSKKIDLKNVENGKCQKSQKSRNFRDVTWRHGVCIM